MPPLKFSLPVKQRNYGFFNAALEHEKFSLCSESDFSNVKILSCILGLSRKILLYTPKIYLLHHIFGHIITKILQLNYAKLKSLAKRSGNGSF
jgi:hypothetical protein